MEKFANVLERSVIINLQENNREAVVEERTLYTIILEKLPEKLMAQYYRWVKENQKVESVIVLKDWTTPEAEYQMQATELKHGLKSGNPLESHADQAGEGVDPIELTKLMVRRKRLTWCVVKVTPSGVRFFKKRSIQEKWSIAKKLGLCYRFLG